MDVKQRVGKKWFASESAANESYLCFLGGETQPNMAKADGMVAELVVGLALATAEYGQRHSQDTLTITERSDVMVMDHSTTDWSSDNQAGGESGPVVSTPAHGGLMHRGSRGRWRIY